MVSDMHLQLVAIVLRRGAALDRASGVLTLLGLVAGLAPLFGITVDPFFSVVAVVMLVLGIAEKYWAQRVAIDAELFSVLAVRTKDFEDAVSQLDAALHQLGLAPAVATPRSLADRSRAALRLLRLQTVFLGAQCLLAVGACIAASWFSFHA